MAFEYSFEETKRFDVVTDNAIVSSTYEVRIRIDNLSSDDVKNLRNVIWGFCE
jgi:hypothetical protein